MLLAIALVPAFVGEAHFNAQSYSLNYARTPERRELDYVRQTGASVETAKEVKIFGLNAFLIERYRDARRELLRRANRRIALRRAGWGSVLTAIGTIAYYVAYAYIVWRTLHGEFTIGDLTFLAGSFRRLRNAARRPADGLLAGRRAGALSRRSVLVLRDPAGDRVAARIRGRFPSPIREGFAFEDVGFRYPGAERWAVRDLTFTLRAGEVLALVGENGAGKTTLVKLLARLYDPDEGRILLDGHDLREYDLFALRANIGVIFQDFVRYHLTAADNIAVGRIEARDDRARIVAAAERSLADEVIASCPSGYDQVLGKRFRTGVDLSGGEWQKIAIARAYMRDAQLLILDEPTAALDARAEFEVFQRFKELSRGKTAVLISHRFSSVRMADRIVVLADGAVEAVGHARRVAARRAAATRSCSSCRPRATDSGAEPRDRRALEFPLWHKGERHMAEKKIIAVMGATGAQGGGLVRAIVAARESSFVARAITRKPDSDKARALARSGSRSWRAMPTIRRASTGRSPAPTAPTASPTSGSISRRSARAPRPRRWRARRARRASSTSSGRRSRTRASGCRSTTRGCRRCRASTRCRTSTPRARRIASSPPRRRRPPTCSPRSTGRTSSTSAWGRGRARATPRARAAARGRQAAGHRRGGHRQVRLRHLPRAARAPWASGSASPARSCRARRWRRRWGARSARRSSSRTCRSMSYRGLGFPGADDLGNMFQFQAILGDEFLRSRDVALSRALNPELQSFDAWLAANIGRIPIG